MQEFLIPDGLEIEILIIDGQSSDNTKNIVETLINNDELVKLLCRIDNVNIRKAVEVERSILFPDSYTAFVSSVYDPLLF